MDNKFCKVGGIRCDHHTHKFKSWPSPICFAHSAPGDRPRILFDGDEVCPCPSLQIQIETKNEELDKLAKYFNKNWPFNSFDKVNWELGENKKYLLRALIDAGYEND